MIACRQTVFTYPGERFQLRVPELEIGQGESVALIGPSGCGKTTLLNLISGNYLASSGEVKVDGVSLASLSLAERQRFRIANIGQVPQNFELLDYLTVKENIELPYRISIRLSIDENVSERCRDLAERAGIEALLDSFPGCLSQGEQQRAALCRGLVTSPRLILADEPTGNLDPENQEKIVGLMLSEAERIGATVLMITHEPTLLPGFDRVVNVPDLREGRGG